MNQMELSFSAKIENESFARTSIGAFIATMNPTVDEVAEVKTIISEGVSNAIIHGYQNNPEQEVSFSVICYADELCIEIKDTGVGIADIHQAMQPSFSTAEERMGLGFSFMQSFMDEVVVVSAPGEGTTVTLKKKMPCNEDA